jgi:DNA-binding response OmpR family regulator
LKVLLVEDDELVRSSVAEVLSDAGLGVAERTTGEEALSAMTEADCPSVLLTDINLGPGIDGFELGTRARNCWPGVGIIYMTGQPWRLAGHDLGPHDRFLAKPFRANALFKAIHDLTAHA